MTTNENEVTQDVWAEDADWPVTAWQYDVGNGDTRLGYWDWVEHNKDTAHFDSAIALTGAFK